jgi:hypothetical protein
MTLGSEYAPAKRGEPVVPPAHVVFIGRWTVARLLDQVPFDEPLECSVKGGWPEPDLAIRPELNILHDRVAVLLLVCEREKDVEPVRFEREKGFR